MVNLINYTRLGFFLVVVCCVTRISTVPLNVGPQHRLRNVTENINHDETQFNNKTTNNNDTESASNLNNTSDLVVGATNYQHPRLHLPVTIKPRGFNLPKSRPAQPKQNEATKLSAQNYYNNYFPELPPLGHAQPYYSLTDVPLIGKFLPHRNEPFQPRQQQQPFTSNDASILGSGDFGILRGGTFYSNEEPEYIHENIRDFYYGDASNTHTVASTEGFIQKYTYPEEQFAQFRDFADLGTPVDSEFSQYVVVYAAKNSTTNNEQNSKPKNIFEQLQEIDKEKALEHKKSIKNQTNSSITKLKLVKTKLMEKKWVKKQQVKLVEDDPLITVS